jgi:hypothetical protein
MIAGIQLPENNNLDAEKKNKNTVFNDVTTNNLKGKPTTKTTK